MAKDCFVPRNDSFVPRNEHLAYYFRGYQLLAKDCFVPRNDFKDKHQAQFLQSCSGGKVINAAKQTT
jgi:hypothetical protein